MTTYVITRRTGSSVTYRTTDGSQYGTMLAGSADELRAIATDRRARAADMIRRADRAEAIAALMDADDLARAEARADHRARAAARGY